MKNKTAFLIAGGEISRDFALNFLHQKSDTDLLVCVDGGLAFLDQIGRIPDILVGDFDTVNPSLLHTYEEKGIEVQRHNPIKDETDTELAIRACIERGYRHIFALGCLGGRIDHELSNLYLTLHYISFGIQLEIIDEKNRIYAISKPTEILKAKQWGKYISFYALAGKVEGLCLVGFLYPLYNVVLDQQKTPTLTVSNEIVTDRAKVFFSSGLLLVVESKDKV